MSSKQALVKKRTHIESLPAELVARIISSRYFSIYELIGLLGVSRQFFYAIIGDPTLWTTLYLYVRAERCLPSYFALLDLALERSGTRTLRLGIRVESECPPNLIRQVAARVVLSADRWNSLDIIPKGTDPNKVVQTWVHELCSLASQGKTSPFTAVKYFAIVPTHLKGKHRFRLDIENHKLSRAFPRLRNVDFHNLEFHAQNLINGLANTGTLESLFIYGNAYSAPALMARDILKRAPGLKTLVLNTQIIFPSRNSTFETPNVLRQTSGLSSLYLAGPLSFLCDELRSLHLPHLQKLALFRYRGAPSGGSLVDDILSLVNESGCRLYDLTVNNISFSNEDLVRLLVALPDLVALKLTFPAGGANHHLFRMLLDRSRTEAVLPKLKAIRVATCPDYEGNAYKFPTNTWDEFVNDPRRQPGGDLSTLTEVQFSFGNQEDMERLQNCIPSPSEGDSGF
ncbi:hypothetical protein CC1G_09881 [Coprinopsis cinerea okayama7|uniref:F-box domain-containing protein n=1 Tax=Coprinopsis cinerea (strain Okayama-7 / 130 / ATCC MYA-4618 / FGSC 9003) TaxID=240176 RepID=A8N8M2_COPC7|nr:hypothetical protein CC1G_09881 [Coprinopsis cinerea okayama7\|eukprot:XP_001831178.1 hypothetical protein CC1G_09881 [Coprinopsis cinerea okayama7\